jgi:hypothetical protein
MCASDRRGILVLAEDIRRLVGDRLAEVLEPVEADRIACKAAEAVLVLFPQPITITTLQGGEL